MHAMLPLSEIPTWWWNTTSWRKAMVIAHASRFRMPWCRPYKTSWKPIHVSSRLDVMFQMWGIRSRQMMPYTWWTHHEDHEVEMKVESARIVFPTRWTELLCALLLKAIVAIASRSCQQQVHHVNVPSLLQRISSPKCLKLDAICECTCMKS